ncbi:hypothetical protein RvY_14497-1 [Ramazzottius varieornatus]|uniref:Uncharacterized protein n=1 Tax=Ramazzottius varieornatus TaxID=947166 RepID=A0A1D1VVC2_RAMVA|nr:hypothetical protein RvY_14497-1 [Ramazzottius varieornatus]
MSDRGASMPAELVTSLHVVVCVFAGKTSNSLLSIHCVDRYSQTDVEDTQLADGLLSLAFRSLGERFSVRASWTAVLHQCFAGRLYNRIFRLEKQYCSRETGSTTLLSAVRCAVRVRDFVRRLATDVLLLDESIFSTRVLND